MEHAGPKAVIGFLLWLPVVLLLLLLAWAAHYPKVFDFVVVTFRGFGAVGTLAMAAVLGGILWSTFRKASRS